MSSASILIRLDINKEALKVVYPGMFIRKLFIIFKHLNQVYF